ncbi:hypothetical protein B0H17DRAFT_1174038 [Mycena rosella]|uniref:Uncharacterized protein n=1 Tax=Mycena rosella TaxID=1033263 RepID=A0AAD7H214_MYCRO|nr:hypothetical protein B0H17DRAFT_1174038 [Mycena rosella]
MTPTPLQRRLYSFANEVHRRPHPFDDDVLRRHLPSTPSSPQDHGLRRTRIKTQDVVNIQDSQAFKLQAARLKASTRQDFKSFKTQDAVKTLKPSRHLKTSSPRRLCARPTRFKTASSSNFSRPRRSADNVDLKPEQDLGGIPYKSKTGLGFKILNRHKTRPQVQTTQHHLARQLKTSVGAAQAPRFTSRTQARDLNIKKRKTPQGLKPRGDPAKDRPAGGTSLKNLKSLKTSRCARCAKPLGGPSLGGSRPRGDPAQEPQEPQDSWERVRVSTPSSCSLAAGPRLSARAFGFIQHLRVSTKRTLNNGLLSFFYFFVFLLFSVACSRSRHKSQDTRDSLQDLKTVGYSWLDSSRPRGDPASRLETSSAPQDRWGNLRWAFKDLGGIPLKTDVLGDPASRPSRPQETKTVGGSFAGRLKTSEGSCSRVSRAARFLGKGASLDSILVLPCGGVCARQLNAR